MRIALVGEALIDFTSTGPLAFQGHAGGSPLNTAVACARLGAPTGYLTQLSQDLFGEALLRHLQENGVDTGLVLRSEAHTTLAFVEHAPGTNRYVFLREGTSDVGWSPRPLPKLPLETAFLHFGSISLLAEPAATAITELVLASAGKRIVVFDPNVRTSLIPDLAAYRARFARWVAATDLLKVSDEDVEALAPGVPPGQAAEGWLKAGPAAVVVTYGASGAILHRAGKKPVSVSAPPVAVVDTIGAGDTFHAAFLVRLFETKAIKRDRLPQLAESEIGAALEFAAAAAAITCSRPGADPPWRREMGM